MFWIFTEGEGDGIESRLSFQIFSYFKEQNSNTYIIDPSQSIVWIDMQEKIQIK